MAGNIMRKNQFDFKDEEFLPDIEELEIAH